jgi:epoxyqueuosine reductase QueG
MVPVSDVFRIAAANGARACGAAPAASLPACAQEIETILPGARSVIVLAAPHSRSAIESANVQVAQYDTIHAYGEAARASHTVALWQNFMTGNYYYCFACQAACPLGKTVRC